MQNDWQNLLWNWTTATEPYGCAQWNVIVEGLLDSLRTFFDIPFVFEKRVFYDIDYSTPRVVFSVTHEPVNPLFLRIVGRCGIHTWIDDDGTRNIAASVSFHYFQGDTRLVAENGTVLLQYTFVKAYQNETIWQPGGWLFDYGETENCTWEDLKR